VFYVMKSKGIIRGTMKTTLSIILPVYNGELFLERTINSILEQDVDDWELIIVNDGSTDKSGEIMEKYMARDSRIKGVSQTNRGLGAARNVGYHESTGEYVVFVDADDYLEPNYYRQLIFAAKKYKSDFVVSSYIRDFVQPNGHSHSETIHFKEQLLDMTQLKEECSNWKYTYNIYIHVWNKIYKRDYLEQHGILFDESIRYAEDIPFNIKNLEKANTVLFLDIPGYHYECHQAERLTGSWKENLIADNCNVYNQIIDFERNFLGINNSVIASGMYLRSCFLSMEKAFQANRGMKEVRVNARKMFKCPETKKSIQALAGKYLPVEFFIYRIFMKPRNTKLFLCAVRVRKRLKVILKR